MIPLIPDADITWWEDKLRNWWAWLRESVYPISPPPQDGVMQKI
jgi:hypothetical protein